MALGADWCNSARGFMFALGCIQAQNCHTGNCPDRRDHAGPHCVSARSVVPTKAQRVLQLPPGRPLHALQEWCRRRA